MYNQSWYKQTFYSKIPQHYVLGTLRVDVKYWFLQKCSYQKYVPINPTISMIMVSSQFLLEKQTHYQREVVDDDVDEQNIELCPN